MKSQHVSFYLGSPADLFCREVHEVLKFVVKSDFESELAAFCLDTNVLNWQEEG
jgi:hypothetical protein